jgi:C4-type Zn-finger protein
VIRIHCPRCTSLVTVESLARVPRGPVRGEAVVDLSFVCQRCGLGIGASGIGCAEAERDLARRLADPERERRIKAIQPKRRGRWK